MKIVKKSFSFLFISYDIHDIHMDIVLTSAESKHFLYRMSLHQDLYGNNILKRVNFCIKICRKMRTDVSFLSHVLFSDEANFANTENVNRHNMHYWANENPRWIRTVHFNIRGPLIVGAALSPITSMAHIFLKVALLGKFTQTFCKTYCFN